MTSSPDYAKAESTAYKTLELYEERLLPISPISLIAKFSNLKVKTYSLVSKEYNLPLEKVCDLFESNDGVTYKLYNGHDNYLIFFNDKVPYKPRIRFALAHELGHICLNHFYSKTKVKCALYNDDLEYDVLEKEANYFAKKLLVPFPLIQKLVENCDSPINAQDIAEIFEVSGEVANHVVENWNTFQERCHQYVSDEKMCEQFSDELNFACNFQIPFLHNFQNQIEKIN